MPVVLNYRASWDIDNKVGVVQLALAGGGAPVLSNLEVSNFNAILLVLASDTKIEYDPIQQRLFSPN